MKRYIQRNRNKEIQTDTHMDLLMGGQMSDRQLDKPMDTWLGGKTDRWTYRLTE